MVHPFTSETRVGWKLSSNLLLDLDVSTNLQRFYIILAFRQVLNVLKRQGKNDNLSINKLYVLWRETRFGVIGEDTMSNFHKLLFSLVDYVLVSFIAF